MPRELRTRAPRPAPPPKRVPARTKAPKTNRLPPAADQGGILTLPTELIQHVAAALPAHGDAVALAQTCRALYHGALSAGHAFFWHSRAPALFGAYDATRGPAQHGRTRRFADYRSALAQNAAGPARGRTDRCCQVCLGCVCQKFWPDYALWICPGCFLDVSVEAVDIKFLRLPLHGVRKQQRGRVGAHRNRPTTYYWRAEVEALVAQHYPGRTLEELLDERRTASASKALSVQDTRERHEERLLASALEQYADPAGQFAKYHRLLAPADVAAQVETIRRSHMRTANRRLHLVSVKLGALKQDKSAAWIAQTARETLLPGAWIQTCARKEAPVWMLQAVNARHVQRFEAAGQWYVRHAQCMDVPVHGDHHLFPTIASETIVLGHTACACAALAGAWLPACELVHHYETQHWEEWLTTDVAWKPGSEKTVTLREYRDGRLRDGVVRPASDRDAGGFCTDHLQWGFLSSWCFCSRRPFT